MTTAIGSYATAAALKAMAGITDSSDDTLIGLICDRVNQYIEDSTGRVLAPISSTTYLYDGDGSHSLYLPRPVDKAPIGGIRATTLVEVQAYTGGSWVSLASGDTFLRQRVGMTGPFERLILSDHPSSGYVFWPVGLGNVRVTGTAGWTAIPDSITDLALAVAQRAWNSRETGQQNLVGTDEMGRPMIARFLGDRDRETLRRFTLVDNLA